MMSKPRVLGLLSVTILFAIASPVSAQWQTSASFSYNITCVKFLQDEGARLTPSRPFLLHGLVGGVQHISYRISAANTSWTSASVPSSWNDGTVSDFTFEDTLVGYAAIHGATSSFYNNSGVSGILKTSDGGVTWGFLSNAPPEVRGIYFDKVNGRLFASSGDVDNIGGNGVWSGVWVSTNHGSSWSRINVTSGLPPSGTPYNQRCYYTGFASWDGIHIVLATEGGPNGCSNENEPPDYTYWLRSSDAGLTWRTVAMTQQSWQPVALKNMPVMYASSLNGDDGSLVHGTVWVSSDYGNSWRQNSAFQTHSSESVTAVMGGDPCLIVVPEHNSTSYFSTDDGQTWNNLSIPGMPFCFRNYVGGDSIWMFGGTQLYSIARPVSKSIHLSPDSVDFWNSGSFTSIDTITLYGCDCSGNSTIISDSIVVLNGANNFTVTGPAMPYSLCGPSSLIISYTPSSQVLDTSILVLNYTVNGQPKSETMKLSGGGAPTSFLTNWGSKNAPSTNAVTFRTTPCEPIDTFITIYNTTATDIQLVGFDTSGGNGTVIWYNNSDVPAPITVPARGGSFTIPIHAASYRNGTYQLLIKITTKSGNTLVSKQFYITMIVAGPQAKPFVRSFDIHMPFACNGHGFDSAIYYFDTTCLPVVITNIYVKNVNDPNFKLDLRTLSFPDTLYPFNSDSGKAYFLRVPIHFTQTKPGTYADSVILEDQLTDGTILRTRAFVRYVIDKAIDYTPASLTNTTLSFDTVTPCDSGRTVTFRFRIHDTCGFPDTLSSVISSLAPGYKILHMPTQNTTLISGTIDSLVIGWPDGYAVGGRVRQGSVIMWFRNGTDSSSITYKFDGFVTPCPVAEVEQPAPNNISIHSDGNKLYIALGDVTLATFELQNLLGETLLTTTVTGTASIDDHSLTPGVYFYRVTIGSRVMTGKITLP